MVKKRSVKVYGQSGYKYRETPTIMLKDIEDLKKKAADYRELITALENYEKY